MYLQNKYNKLTFYLEACESGSMFAGLLNNSLNIYSVTASSPHQSSWACYCEKEAIINNKKIGTCLGDCFSVNWIENAEIKTNLNKSL